MTRRPLHLFEAWGIELEYMIVDAQSLDVKPVTDQVLHAVTGDWVGDYEHGPIGWSNELVLHVIELKTNGPSPRLEGLADRFLHDLSVVQGHLDELGARLMPTAMHPWMDPARETRLWPHDSSPIYEKFHAIFDCRGHGWSNLQSMHVNLPFQGDAEFARLHAAVRMVLPLLPALAASSPLVEGKPTGLLDTRMEVYRHNARRVPSVSGLVVPEPARSREEYERVILGAIYRDLAPHDPEGILRFEWANARGCIARFDRDALEIRVLDLQENPRADLAVAALVTEVVRALAAETHASVEEMNAIPTEELAQIFRATLRDAEATLVDHVAYLRALGLNGPLRAGEAWSTWMERTGLLDTGGEFASALRLYRERGSLARRILRAVGPDPSSARLREVYGHLCDGLLPGRPFDDREFDRA